MLRYYIDNGGIICDRDKHDYKDPLACIVTLEKTVALINNLSAVNEKLTTDLEAANEKIKQLLGGEEAWLAFCDAENMKKENVVLNRKFELACKRLADRAHCPYVDCNKYTGWRPSPNPTCYGCWLDYFRAEAEKG